jgi:hypothetical protein
MPRQQADASAAVAPDSDENDELISLDRVVYLARQPGAFGFLESFGRQQIARLRFEERAQVLDDAARQLAPRGPEVSGGRFRDEVPRERPAQAERGEESSRMSL